LGSRIVIVPTYKEEENIEAIIDRVMALEKRFDMLVVDDNSPDATAQMVQARQQRYPDRLHMMQRPGKQGLGTAYLQGFEWALTHGYEQIFEMDADFSHNPDDLSRLAGAIENQHADVAIGSRYITGVNVVNWPMGRVLLSYFASTYVRAITQMPVRDATAGFVGYHRRVLSAMPLDKIRFKGYAFQIEMKFTAWKMGFALVEVPIIFTDRTRGESKMNHGIIREAVLGVLSMKMASWFRRYPKIPPR
jgi:dolichol-phosphate mannosyltransferase